MSDLYDIQIYLPRGKRDVIVGLSPEGVAAAVLRALKANRPPEIRIQRRGS